MLPITVIFRSASPRRAAVRAAAAGMAVRGHRVVTIRIAVHFMREPRVEIVRVRVAGCSSSGAARRGGGRSPLPALLPPRTPDEAEGAERAGELGVRPEAGGGGADCCSAGRRRRSLPGVDTWNVG